MCIRDRQRTGCRALLAQKAFSNFDVYPVLAPYLAGTEASGLYASRLGREQLPEKAVSYTHLHLARLGVDPNPDDEIGIFLEKFVKVFHS